MRKKTGKTVAFHNLGCKVNSYEAEIMLQQFRERGYTVVPFEEKADVYVVNTCTVTQIADKKSRQMLRRAKRINPEAVVVAAGCYVETDAAALAADDAIDLTAGNLQKGRIAELVENYLQRRAEGAAQAPAAILMPRTEIAADPVCGAVLKAPPILRTRAFVKIQDGCDQFCSYCVIPYARGRARSRGTAEIVREVRGLAAQGVREVVLTGIHLSSFDAGAGRRGGAGEASGGFDSAPLIGLIAQLSEIGDLARIRLGSLEPRLITEETARAFAALADPARGGKLCPHFHLSLQSGCDETLRRMNRHYTAKRYAESVSYLRAQIERPAVTTDVIVGFPGETAEEFAETERFLGALGLYEVHVFPYSRRAGTIAAGMPGQTTRAEKEERSAALLALAAAQAKAYREGFLGEELRVLWEEEEEIDGARYLTGHTERYLRTALSAESARARGIVPGVMTAARAERILTDGSLLLV